MKYNIDKISRQFKGNTYKVGDILNPPCGFKPTDYIITGFIERKKYTSMVGYHPASENKYKVIRGCWPNEEIEKGI